MSYIPMTHSEKDLFNMIQSDNLIGFSDLYLYGKYVNKEIENSQKVTILGEAVKRNALKIAEFIVSKNPNEMYRADSNGNLPLSNVPLLEPKKEIIEIFEKYGFDFSSKIGSKGNILHIVAPNGKVDLFKSLIEKGANPEELNERDDKPKDIARRWGNSEVESYIENHYTSGRQVIFDFTM